ncbi:terminase small subunit [Macrococcus capreoli]|uniref:terminase small subunit n=1 Tax=Macrococcus capreoli TaxID=2982690 RepID=UPI003EE70424
MKLTERQRRFADEYIITGNAYRSCIDAGYSEKYAKARSHDLLENVGIKTYIDERLNLLKSNKIAEQQEVLEYLTSVMRGQQQDVEVLSLSVGKGVQELKTIEKRADTSARIRSAELLGKRYGLWIEKQETTTNGVVMIQVGEWNDEIENEINTNHPNSTIFIDDIPLEDD